MNILDENILEDQRQLLLNWRVPFRQISYEVGRKGMKDDEIIPFFSLSAKRLCSLLIAISTSASFATRDTVWFTWMSSSPKQPLSYAVCCVTLNLILRPNE